MKRKLCVSIMFVAMGVLISGCSGPKASFGEMYVVGGLYVNFNDTSDPGRDPILTWTWNFGDATSSTEQNPIHTYAAAGTYLVSLTVTTASGSDTKTKNITVPFYD